MSAIHIDFSKSVGKVKPVHGVNSGPRTKVFTYDATELFREAGLPFSRLHDTEYPYGSGEFVDIHCVFPNFDADENDPASYNFALTDLYIDAIRKAGTDVIYRLGESIEHAPVKRHVWPPKDFAKWARICEHIIRHYNEGWADGHHWNIAYWEIWNEPDNGIACWGGTNEEFFDFFETAAKHLTACFPSCNIGGPALAGNFAWGERFLREMRKRGVPMDFFSWHRYTADAHSLRDTAYKYRALMDDCGYRDAEMLLDEWNYMEDWSNQAPSYRKLVAMHGAAFCAASLIEMQHSPVNVAAYFEADVVKEWCGLFEVEDMAIGTNNNGKLRPRKPFYAFRAFNDLYKMETEVFSESDDTNVFVCASSNGEKAGAMIAVYGAEDRTSYTMVRLNGLPEDDGRITFRKPDENGDRTFVMQAAGTGRVCEVMLPMRNNEIWEIKVNGREP